MPPGTVKKVISDRGFGFITGEDGKDYFFHRDGLERSLDFDRLAGGEKVAFEIEPSARVIAEYKHRAQTVTCVCGWHGSTATSGATPSEWNAHLAANRLRKP